VKVRYPVTGDVVALPLAVSAGRTVRVEHRFAQLEARAYFEATEW
jgi:hypothetical protein